MAKTENSEKNSKKRRTEQLRAYQFKPGQSGNPGGRPKKPLLTDACEEMLLEKLQDPLERKKFKDAMWLKLLSGKVVGSMTLDTLLDRTEGRLAVPVRVNGELKISMADAIKEARERAANIE